jgi:CRISPR-associated protein Csb1
LVIEARLRPVAGARFQPAGFPEVGHVIYDAPRSGPDGSPAPPEKVCIVDSAASMANHLEKVCWDETGGDLHADLKGLPYVRLEATARDKPAEFITCSILQDHRVASSYFIDAQCREPQGVTLGDHLHDKGGFQETAKRAFLPPRNRAQAIRSIFALDPNSLVHGTFFPQKRLGNFRLARLLTAGCEAFGARRWGSSGVKFDPIGFKHAKDTNYGQSIFPRDEETAEKIVAWFVVDLEQLRHFGLEPAQASLLLGLCLWKINAFLQRGTRLRSGCDLTLVPALTPREDGAKSDAALPGGGGRPALGLVTARLDSAESDGKALLALSEGIQALIQGAYPDGRSDRAFVVEREYAELIRKGGQAADADEVESETSDEQSEAEEGEG